MASGRRARVPGPDKKRLRDLTLRRERAAEFEAPARGRRIGLGRIVAFALPLPAVVMLLWPMWVEGQVVNGGAGRVGGRDYRGYFAFLMIGYYGSLIFARSIVLELRLEHRSPDTAEAVLLFARIGMLMLLYVFAFWSCSGVGW